MSALTKELKDPRQGRLGIYLLPRLAPAIAQQMLVGLLSGLAGLWRRALLPIRATGSRTLLLAICAARRRVYRVIEPRAQAGGLIAARLASRGLGRVQCGPPAPLW